MRIEDIMNFLCLNIYQYMLVKRNHSQGTLVFVARTFRGPFSHISKIILSFHRIFLNLKIDLKLLTLSPAPPAPTTIASYW